jgi:hypothetical protein
MADVLTKNQTANVGKYAYQYVDIAQIHEYLEGINATYIQQIKRIENDDYIMTKRCFKGEWETEWLQGCKVVDATLIGVKNPAQEQGSALTYARRYSLLMAFGLATEDNDAQSLSKKVEPTKEDAESYEFKSGKHEGWTLKRVVEEDKNFLKWLLNNSKDEYLLKCIELLTGEIPMTEEEHDERLELTQKLMRLIVDKGVDLDKMLEHYQVSNVNELNNDQLNKLITNFEKR